MGNMEGFGIFLWNAVITLFCFFALAPIVLSAISTFGVQKRFAQTMVDEGVISAEDVKLLLPKKQLAGVIISVVVAAAVVYSAVKMMPFGPICALFGLVAGIMKYRKVLQFNSLTVQRFKSTFKDSYNAKKLNAYVDKMF